MPGGGFAVTRSHGGEERFYNAGAMRRLQVQQQQELMQQQEQLQRHHQLMLHQQQLQIQRHHHNQHQRFMRRPPPPPAAVQAEKNRADVDDSTSATLAKQPKQKSVVSAEQPPAAVNGSDVTNLDRFLKSVTPLVPSKNLYQVNVRGHKSREAELHPFYSLGDLWESFREWSVYGAGVPLLLNGGESVVQYYVPYLSGMQLYIDPLKPPPMLRRPGIDSEGDSSLKDKAAESSPEIEAEISISPGLLVFEYLEREQPYLRQPLADKVSALESQYPELRTYKSCDLLPSSWLCVAWYPIYRIPVGPTLKDLEASFLTLHSLSTDFRSCGSGQPWFPRANYQNVPADISTSSNVSLPVFGLASYKLKGSLMIPCGSHELEQENALMQAAGNWLQRLKVILPDYKFFSSHHSQRR